MTSFSPPAPVRAPELRASGNWLNSAPLTLADLRGRFVLLDFWTFCCANCLHVLDELRPLERTHAETLTVVGVHSPKFSHEADPVAVTAALERYGVHHPVVNDPELRLWQQYAVRAWPTLVLIDPEGYVLAQAAGEGQVSALDELIRAAVPYYEQRGTLRSGGGPELRPDGAAETTLRFPAKAILIPAERSGRGEDSLLVADAGHSQLVELSLDGSTVLRRIGSGQRSAIDGPAAIAAFAEPNGLTLLPVGAADFDVAVADTASHVVRGVRLSDGNVCILDLPAALAGVTTVTGSVPAVLSPWDVAWSPARDRLVVAAAGVHLLLSVDPRTGAAEILAGTTVEGLRDGPAADGWLAQPSGLAIVGDVVWFVDAETSALRYLSADGTLHTAVGQGLFDFGLVDGTSDAARMQHPLGLTPLPDGSIAVMDTYNGAVRRWHDGQLTTLATGLHEPSGGVVVDGELVVVESGEHRLVRPQLAAQPAAGTAEQTVRPPTVLAAGTVRLEVVFTPPPGRELDERYGPATQLSVTASPTHLLVDGDGIEASLVRTLTLADDVDGGVLHISAHAASCDKVGEHPACYLARQDWGVPVQLGADGSSDLTLMLLG